MNSTAAAITTLAHFPPSRSAELSISISKFQPRTNPRRAGMKLHRNQNNGNSNSLSKSTNCAQLNLGIRTPAAAVASCATTATEAPAEMVSDKLKRLVLEFRSLPEPIDRVKRLLHYAARLPGRNESTREPESRVPGCSTQVWVGAQMDELGRMRFWADSDSEISKGFCSCLIWMLDGAAAEEVLAVETRDLEDVNVGVYGKVNSRVNTWHNVLLAMQRRTRDLVAERQLASLLVSSSTSNEVSG